MGEERGMLILIERLQPMDVVVPVVDIIVSLAAAVSCVCAILICGVLIGEQRRLKEQKNFLKVQQEAVRMHYAVIKSQLREMEEKQQKIDRQMKKISQMEDLLADSGRIAVYLAELKENYEGICSGIYCDNWMIDAVLCAQSALYKRQGIVFECLMQGCDFAGVQEEDFVKILLSLLEMGRNMNLRAERPEDKKVRLCAATVKNQLVIEFTSGNVGRSRFSKKRLKECLKNTGGGYLDTKERASCKLYDSFAEGIRQRDENFHSNFHCFICGIVYYVRSYAD